MCTVYKNKASYYNSSDACKNLPAGCNEVRSIADECAFPVSLGGQTWIKLR